MRNVSSLFFNSPLEDGLVHSSNREEFFAIGSELYSHHVLGVALECDRDRTGKGWVPKDAHLTVVVSGSDHGSVLGEVHVVDVVGVRVLGVDTTLCPSESGGISLPLLIFGPLSVLHSHVREGEVAQGVIGSRSL